VVVVVVTNVKVQNTFHERHNITCSTNCKYRTAIYDRNMVCFRYIIVNTLHNSDNKDDDDDDDNTCHVVRKFFF